VVADSKRKSPTPAQLQWAFACHLAYCAYLVYTVTMADVSTTLRLGPVSPASSGPLYQQIVDGIKREVLANRLTAGSALPSYRVLAEQLLVSLITVKRAYEELEREGITFSRQGLGTFVAARGNDRTRADRRAVAREALRSAIHAGREAGMVDRELVQMLRDELKSPATESIDSPMRGSAP
jgi:GntR family transcriptional regulator